MNYFFIKLFEFFSEIFPDATASQIVKGIFWSFALLVNGGFVLYNIIDMIKFNRDLKKSGKEFEKELKESANKFMALQKQKIADIGKHNEEMIKQAADEVNQRINLLSKENSRLMEENEFLKGKLKNLGFNEESLKI